MDLLIENPLENNGFYTKNSKHNGRLGIPGYWKIIVIEGDAASRIFASKFPVGRLAAARICPGNPRCLNF